MEEETLNLPTEEPLPGTSVPAPYVLVGDEIFGLHEHLMKPYPKDQLNEESTIFNYRYAQTRTLAAGKLLCTSWYECKLVWTIKWGH